MTSLLKKILKKIFPSEVVKLIKMIKNFRLVQGPLTYNKDGLATRHNCDFMNDPLFKEAYKLGKRLNSWGRVDIHWRAYIACWAANKVKSLEGDFVECGVYKGGLAIAVMHYVNFKTLQKKFYLLDTFCGLSEKYISEGESLKLGRYEECYESVKETFKEFKNVEIIRGIVPGTLPLVKAEKVCYLSLDMNCAEPEIAAAEFFWDKLVSGAIVVLDDYGWKGHIMQKRAFDEFASKKSVQVLQLPTGQGLIFKP